MVDAESWLAVAVAVGDSDGDGDDGSVGLGDSADGLPVDSMSRKFPWTDSDDVNGAAGTEKSLQL